MWQQLLKCTVREVACLVELLKIKKHIALKEYNQNIMKNKYSPKRIKQTNDSGVSFSKRS